MLVLLHSSLDQTAAAIKAFTFHGFWSCLMYVGFAFPIVAKYSSKLHVICAFFTLSFRITLVEMPVLLDFLIYRIDDCKVIRSLEEPQNQDFIDIRNCSFPEHFVFSAGMFKAFSAQ